MRRSTAVILVATASVALMAQADKMPKRKPGLWDMTVSTGMAGVPPQASKMCIDAALDAALYNYSIGATKQACSKNQIKSDGKSVTSDAVCSVGGSQMTSHSTTNFTGDTAFHTEIKAHYEPPMLGLADIAMTQDGKWAGPCPADMKPGEVVGPGGQKMNMKQMMGQ
jgi:hypothetical protein